MLSEFLRYSNSSLRLAVLSGPSSDAHQLIRSLWSQNHTVFPIVPHKSGYLSHFLTEGRCDALLVSPSLENPITESAHIASRSLGLPLIPFPPKHTVSPASETLGTIILESVARSSTVPLAGLIEGATLSSFIDRNRKFSEISPSSAVLSFGLNWLLDAESFKPVFPSACVPEVVVLDCETVKPFLRDVADNRISAEKLHRIIFDAPLIHESLSLCDEDAMNSLKELGRPIFVRHVVPELGPIGPLVPLERFQEKQLQAVVETAHPSISLRLEDNRLLVKSSARFSGYVGRDLSSSQAFSEDGFFQCSFAPAGRTSEQPREFRRKRRTMAPDWRVRKVPIAVYHKRRGFKGQIYYTTKHKGWSFYRSRYYN